MSLFFLGLRQLVSKNSIPTVDKIPPKNTAAGYKKSLPSLGHTKALKTILGPIILFLLFFSLFNTPFYSISAWISLLSLPTCSLSGVPLLGDFLCPVPTV
uniref:Uncharacterized protein n=1 Tax=Cacopsylla melanoneura TaxID=428564 RepID=A0A8D9FIW9_9HEMI